ncbi:MAG: DUF3014 domain-containing protein [Methylovulum sp.]|nr:DUF3014 domain-containing protein [Methylovulum sp.]
MARYDRSRSKKSGRYRDDMAADREPIYARNKGINFFVVIMLIVIAVTVGFFGAKLSEGDIAVKELAMSLFAKKSTPQESTGSNKLVHPQPPAEPVSSNGDLQELQPPQESVILPELDSSDEQIREAVMATSPTLSQWLETDHLISKYMTIVNDFAQGVRVAKHLDFLKLDQSFVAEQRGAELFMSEKSYQRYNNLAQAVNAIDMPAMIAVYRRFRPLLLQVFAKFSYPDGYNLDDIFIKAATEILMAPIVEEPIVLVKPSLSYRFADPELEALNPVHKQMLRMGAENTRLIQNKMRILVDGLVNSKS